MHDQPASPASTTSWNIVKCLGALALAACLLALAWIAYLFIEFYLGPISQSPAQIGSSVRSASGSAHAQDPTAWMHAVKLQKGETVLVYNSLHCIGLRLLESSESGAKVEWRIANADSGEIRFEEGPGRSGKADLFEKIKVVSERTVPGEVSRQQIADDGGTTTIGCGAVASIEWSHSDWIYPVPGFNIAFVEMAGDWDAVTPRFAPVQPETQTLR